MNVELLKPESFFDLERYEHKVLFKGLDFVWEPLGCIADYLESYSLGEHHGKISKDAFLVHPELIFVGAGSVIEPGAYVQGPCIIGNHCTIRHGAYIRGGVITGDHCVIGHATEIKNSILLNRSQAAHFAYVGDSILGNQVNLGAGAKLSNLLFSKKDILIQQGDVKTPTHRRKLGCILGDGAQVGCNSVTNPGTLIGAGARIYPCLSVSGVISAHQSVKENLPSSTEIKHVFS